MTTRRTIDEVGRLVIAKPVREELHLEAGDTLELANGGEQITLRPVRDAVPLPKEHGVRVFRTGQSLPASTTDEVLQRLPQRRDLDNLVKPK